MVPLCHVILIVVVYTKKAKLHICKTAQEDSLWVVTLLLQPGITGNCHFRFSCMDRTLKELEKPFKGQRKIELSAYKVSTNMLYLLKWASRECFLCTTKSWSYFWWKGQFILFGHLMGKNHLTEEELSCRWCKEKNYYIYFKGEREIMILLLWFFAFLPIQDSLPDYLFYLHFKI